MNEKSVYFRQVLFAITYMCLTFISMLFSVTTAQTWLIKAVNGLHKSTDSKNLYVVDHDVVAQLRKLDLLLWSVWFCIYIRLVILTLTKWALLEYLRVPNSVQFYSDLMCFLHLILKHYNCSENPKLNISLSWHDTVTIYVFCESFLCCICSGFFPLYYQSTCQQFSPASPCAIFQLVCFFPAISVLCFNF